MSLEFTGNIAVWNSCPEYKPTSSAKNLVADGENDEAVAFFHYTDSDMRDHGWVHVGNAVFTVMLFDESILHGKQLEALKAELQSVRADNQRKENAILDRISKLQALTFDVQEAT